MTGNDTAIQPAPALAPTPKQIDALVREYAEAQKTSLSAGTVLKTANGVQDEIKVRLVAMVETFGFQHTEKSKRLEGLHSKATTTTATPTVIVDAAVDALRTYLQKQEMPEVAASLFMQHISYSLVAAPSEVLKTMDLKTRIRTKMVGLIAGCFEIRKNAPSLKVELVEAEKPATAAKAA